MIAKLRARKRSSTSGCMIMFTAGTCPRRRARREAEPPFGDVTMSVHKLSADSGYDYLTRQVAACD